MFLHHHPVDLCAVGRAQVDDAKSELVSAHFGVTARDLRVGEWDGAFGHAADDRRLVTECDAAAVGEYQRARRALPPTDDLGVDPEVALTGVLVEHERHLDEALEVVALVAAVLARGVGELSGQCVVEPGEALEVVARQPDREPVRRDRAAYAERAAGVHLAPDAATDLNGLEAAAAERLREGAFDQPLKPSLEPLQSHRVMLPARPPAETCMSAGTIIRSHARVAELADAQDSGSCARKGVGVQVPPRAHLAGRADLVIAECHRQDLTVRATAEPVSVVVDRDDLEPARPVGLVTDEYF